MEQSLGLGSLEIKILIPLLRISYVTLGNPCFSSLMWGLELIPPLSGQGLAHSMYMVVIQSGTEWFSMTPPASGQEFMEAFA